MIVSLFPVNAIWVNSYTLLTRTDNPSQQGTNFHKMTRGRGTLTVNGLDTLVKPTP